MSSPKVGLAGIGILGAVLVTILSPTYANEFTTEWLLSNAVVDGVDPSSTNAEFRDLYGVPLNDPDARAPRTPGALLLYIPLVLVPFDALGWVSLVLVLGEAVVVAWMLSRLLSVEYWQITMWMPLFFVWVGGAALIGTGGSSMIMLGCLVGTMLLARSEDRYRAGLPLGLAISIKLWPWVLVPVLFVSGRRRAAIGACASFAALNTAGLLLPSVTIRGSLRSLIGGSQFLDHPGNGSILAWTGPVGYVVVGALLVGLLLWARRQHWETAFIVSIPIAIMSGPLAWVTYLVSASLSLMWAVRQVGGARIIAAGVALIGLGWMISVPTAPVVTVSLLLITVAAIMAGSGPVVDAAARHTHSVR